MLVFKFGGASVKNAASVKNLANIVRKFKENMVVVISAMGKTTNALEQVVDFYFHQNLKELEKSVENLKAFHYYIMKGLFDDGAEDEYTAIKKLFAALDQKLALVPSESYDYEYDQIICFGELLSTKIVSMYLESIGAQNSWVDIRKSLKTNKNYREAKVDWEKSEEGILKNFHFGSNNIFVTQGFIASSDKDTTTLGREGSDYTAAIIGSILESEKVIIWKDVPGVLNADPKWFDDTVLLEGISYKDAIELTYYGTSVIHPKTIQPLKRKSIPLYVKSFIEPEGTGTKISVKDYDRLIPNFIFKMDQVLISISSKDLSFIAEDNMETILGSFARNNLKINLMQNSATSFQLCVNNDKRRIQQITDELKNEFNIYTENHLELATIRYYDQATIDRITVNKFILLEQHNQNTVQLVMRDQG